MRRLPAYTDKTTFSPLPPHTLYTATNITMDDTVDTISRMAFEGELDMNVHYTNKKKDLCVSRLNHQGIADIWNFPDFGIL